MRKLKCFMFVAALALALIGCRKPVEVSFAFNEKEVASEGQTFDLGLESNGDWTITTSAEWVSATPNSGSGNATLSVTASPNTTSDSRTAKVTATTKDNTAELTLTQNGGEYIMINPTSIQSSEEGGDYTVDVTSNFQWTITDVPSWLSLSATSGTGSETVVVTVLPIGSEYSAHRTAELVFGNEQVQAEAVLTVTQGPAPQTLIFVTPSQLQMACEGETKTVNVVCEGEWTAEVSEDWVTLDLTQGSGDKTVSISVSENPVYVSRRTMASFRSSTGAVAIVSIILEASPDPHFLDVTPTSISFGNEGGNREITIGCDTDWKADASADWLSLSETLGSGNATVVLTAEPNLLNEVRSTSVVVASDNIEREITVTQAAGMEQLYVTLSPDTLYVASTGGSSSLSLASNTTWMLEGSNIVAYLSPMSGNGDANISTIIDVNSGEEPRMGYIRASHNGEVFGEVVIVQEGKPDLLETDITEMEVRAEGGEFTFHVTSNQNWTVSTDVEWIRCTPDSGFGNSDVTVTVDEMMTLHPRTGTIRVKAASGKIVTVTVSQQH